MSTTTDNLIGRLVEGMPSADYHATDAVSASRLKAMRRSAMHCKWEMEHPRESDAMRMGTAVHAAVLEPERYASEFVFAGNCDAVKRNGGACGNPGKVMTHVGSWRCGVHAGDAVAPGNMMTAEDAATVRGIADAVEAHPLAGKLLALTGMVEVSAFWIDPETGEPCKLRADAIVDVPGFGRVCLDLKTCRDASPDAFKFAARSLGYDVAASHYLNGLARVGVQCDAFAFLAVETDPPFGVGLYLLDDADLDKGRTEAGRLMKQISTCRQTGLWPGYGDSFQRLTLPRRAWEFAEQDAY